MKLQALFAAALLSLSAAGAEAACDRPSQAQPVVPNGAKADEASMKEAHNSIQGYVVQLEAYKACLKTQIESAPADTSVETKMAWAAQGDAAVDAANYLANQFSYSLKAFKEREKAASTPAAPPAKQ